MLKTIVNGKVPFFDEKGRANYIFLESVEKIMKTEQKIFVQKITADQMTRGQKSNLTSSDHKWACWIRRNSLVLQRYKSANLKHRKKFHGRLKIFKFEKRRKTDDSFYFVF